MPIIIAVVALLNGLLAIYSYKQYHSWGHPAVKARIRVTGVMLLVSLFLFFYL
ncbi:MAG: hypothetical protein N0E55_08090 [Candidatus Thiodiazotropha taylori]|uniref:Uncharacterized protein n=1 Tax=Candidatus Thiodiazotropha taylori TaxID=2792791 RepID=A0A9E4N7R3_9GAMM|nr:hypothetical protein [Candidatus Thiodiazotropha taylori]MCG8028521.1 hypothetical protein [Candidatus Thiodiazotropha taylori]MCG8042744.1 hypothetical protein [Candidatus Thiodiazotropha taylori]MCG8098602.1 hypothetical protein [Candidatus Thiodiazotropha taylori]MCG8109867.1 hypothetical protein [Candidatus Thiodiazotropha taylori]